jgi:carbonic anhydrase
VLGIFFQLTKAKTHTPYFNLTQFVINPQDSYVESENLFSLEKLIQRNKFHIYTYPGSLTSPNCQPVVTWMVSTGTTPISSCELAALRKLKNEEGKLIKKSFRPVQPLNGRKVTYLK